MIKQFRMHAQIQKRKYLFLFIGSLFTLVYLLSCFTLQLFVDNVSLSFITAGAGLGRTFHSITPSLRIDVVLVSPAIQVVQYYSPQLDLSNHYPIITDIQLRH